MPGCGVLRLRHFFITFGRVKTGLIDHLGMAYFMFLAPLVFILAKTIGTLFVLNRKIFGDRFSPARLCMHCSQERRPAGRRYSCLSRSRTFIRIMP